MKTRDRLRPHQIAKLAKTIGSHNDGGSLYLVVRPSGAAWVYKFKHGQAYRSRGLGAFPETTLAMARQRRDAIRDGHKPLENATLAELANRFFELHADEYGKGQLLRNRALLRLHAGPIMKLKAGSITREQVATVLRPIWGGSSNSRGIKLRALLSRLFDASDAPVNPANLERLRPFLPVQKRKSVPVASLPYAEISEVMAELRENNRTGAAALRFIVLTALRLTAARGLRWDEIDLDKRVITIPASRMKSRVAFAVPLSNEAISLLGHGGAGGPFVFPGRRRDQMIGQNAVRLCVSNLGRVDGAGRDITCHGFRSTFATWAQEQRDKEGRRLYDSELIEACLAHFSGGLVGTYQRSEFFDARARLMESWSKFCV